MVVLMRARRWTALAVVAAIAMAAIGLWLTFHQRDGGGAVPDGSTTAAPQATSPFPPLAAPQPQRPVLPPAPVAPLDEAPLDAERAPQVVGPHPDDPHLPGMLPHPMTEARQRLHAENRLLQRLNQAMDGRDVQAMRLLVSEYARLDPTDRDASQVGYTLIADCIEHPSPTSLHAAHQFYDTQRHSPLRRYLRRVCFEDQN